MDLWHVLLVLAQLTHVYSSYIVPVEIISKWPLNNGSGKWKLNGACNFTVDSFLRKAIEQTDVYQMRSMPKGSYCQSQYEFEEHITLNPKITEFGVKVLTKIKLCMGKEEPLVFLEIWVMDVIGSTGYTYELKNKYNIHVHQKSLYISFIVTYSGTAQNYPKGACFSDLPVPITSTTTPAIQTKVTTTTTAKTTTATKPTTTQEAPYVSCPKSVTPKDGQTSNIEKMQDTWGNPSKKTRYFKGRCKFYVSGSKVIGEVKIDMCFNKKTRKMEIWNMNINAITNGGKYYSLSNKYQVQNTELDIQFIVKYVGDETTFPLGTCYSNLNGSPEPSTLLPSTTFKPTTSLPKSSTMEPTTKQTTTTTQQSSSTSTQSSTTTKSNPVNTSHDYGLVLEKSILFYEAQRSGDLPPDNRISWRGDSALGDIGKNGEDLSGGWYDAGDHVKFNLPMSHAVTTLAIGLWKWKDAYISANQLLYMYDSIQWPLDYLEKCWIPSENIYYAQSGDSGSDVSGGTVAAFAAGALAFNSADSTYAKKLLSKAKSLYEFAKSIPGTYGGDLPESQKFYPSTSFKDEMCLGAILLYLAELEVNKKTNVDFKNEAIQFYSSLNPSRWAFDWDNKLPLCEALLYEVTKESSYKSHVESFVADYMPGGSVPYTNCGLAYRLMWAPNRYAANAAFIALLAADLGIGNPSTYKTWAMSQIHYMLGDNNLDMSYVIGYGSKYPLNPHHRASSCPSPPSQCSYDVYLNLFPNTHVLEGALVGGPFQNDQFPDNRDNHQTNEVAIDYNAGFQSAVAGLLHFASKNELPSAPVPIC